MKINYNGNIIGENESFLTIHNRAFRYGDGVFDLCKYSYQKLIFWEEHYLRLMAGRYAHLAYEYPDEFVYGIL